MWMGPMSWWLLIGYANTRAWRLVHKECDKSTLFRRDFNIINANGEALLGPSPQVEGQHALITYVILACGSQSTMLGPFQYSRREISDTQLNNQPMSKNAMQ